MIYLAIISILLAAISEAIMDKIQFHYYESFFFKLNPQFWNPKKSGTNKWKNGDRNQGEKFFLSSTLLVFTTDAWHLFKMARTLFIFCALFFVLLHSIGFCKSILITVILRVVFGLIFTLFFDKILKTKN